MWTCIVLQSHLDRLWISILTRLSTDRADWDRFFGYSPRQGQQLAVNNDAAAPGENQVGYDAYLRYTFAAGGNFYIGVSNANNVAYNAVTGDGDLAGGLHSTGNYQLIGASPSGGHGRLPH